MADEKQMTEEEMKEQAQTRKKEWDEFLETLKKNTDEPVTKGELLKAIEVISEEMGSLAQVIQVIGHNTNVLNQNLQGLMNVIRGGGPAGPAQKTPGGIIVP